MNRLDIDKEVEALADRMWRVHPKDLDAAGYMHKSHGGLYDHPRVAWYADQIHELIEKVIKDNKNG